LSGAAASALNQLRLSVNLPALGNGGFLVFLTTATRENATQQSSLGCTHAILNDGISDGCRVLSEKVRPLTNVLRPPGSRFADHPGIAFENLMSEFRDFGKVYGEIKGRANACPQNAPIDDGLSRETSRAS